MEELNGDDTFHSMGEPQSIQDKSLSNPPSLTRSRSSRTSESEFVEGLETVSLDVSTDAVSLGMQLNASFSVANLESKPENTPVSNKPSDYRGNDVVDATSNTIHKPKEFPSVSQYFNIPEPISIPPSDPKMFFEGLSSEISPMMKSVADITLLDDKEAIEVATAADERESATLSCPEVSQEETQNEIAKKQSLQSLFNEDKFGSDVVGKAFFDAIAGQTLEVPTPKDKTLDGAEYIKATTESIPYESPKSSPESYFSESFDKDSFHDAWIPCQKTQVALRAAVTSSPGTYIPAVADLTMPGVIIEDHLEDPVKLLLNELNMEEAKKRQCLTADNVSQDDKGLLQLIRAKCYHAAINLTQRLLTAVGQGPGRGGNLSQHSPYSLQLWLTRLTLFIKLRQFSFVEVESVAFGDLDRPDVYYEFYPESYPGKKGSMASFSFRLLLAGLPQYQGNYHASLDRLYALLEVIKKIIDNLNKGLAEDGSMMELSESRRKASLKLWQSRECRTLYCILNCMVTHKDYIMAINVTKSLLEKDKVATSQLYSTLGKIYLQLGDIHSANDCFQSVLLEQANLPYNVSHKVEELVQKALMCIVQNAYPDAYKYYKEAYTLQPSNTALANNMAVCLLYMGKLKDSLNTLEKTILSDPKQCLHEGVLFNTCILYELESTNSMTKKESMLKLAAENCGDSFQTNCLKIDSSVRNVAVKFSSP